MKLKKGMGLKAYLRPVLKGGIHITTAMEEFLKYQWYKNGLPIPMPIHQPTR